MLNRQRVMQIVKLAVFVTACFFIYTKLFADGDFKFFDLANELFTYRGIKIFILIFILMIINWLLESLKWKYSTETIQRITITQGIISVLNGVYLSMITPNRVGDGIGKIGLLQKSRRSRGTYAFIVGSISQVIIVSLIGAIALWISPVKFINDIQIWIAFKLLISLVVALLIVAYYYKPWRKKLAYFIGKMWRTRAEVDYNSHQLNTILSLSFLRYLIFTTQFYLALEIFHINIDFISCQIGVAIMYLFSTWIPSLLLGDLGIRESVAIGVFSKFTLFPEVAFVASICIWFVNLLIPAIVGMFLFHFKRKKS